MAAAQYDFLTLGETLIRLSPPGAQRLDQARLFEVGIGGSELNVACLLARLGRCTAWVSRLTEGPLGRIVEGEARRHGVDMSLVTWVEDRQGLMFFEAGPAPRNARVIYDRKNSAAAGMRLDDVDWPALVAASRRIHLSGITPALSATCKALVLEVAALAGRAGTPLSYDLNYRATLTTAAEAEAVLAEVAPHLELFVVAERDAQHVLGFAQAGEPLAEAIAARYGMPLVALTRSPDTETGDILLSRGTFRYAPRYPVEIVDRIGAGDSFVGGLIHGLLDGDLDRAIRLAAYAGAVALATPGDINYFAAEDLAAFEADLTGRLVR
ncbi:MAG: sugar kinase [Alphaproteobacteria bacterium]|nr:sugar kinase [Alphaproteobacteria bacterium]